MSATPVVSVIVIFLDERELLQEAIDTVVGQDFEDWELLLCDDGSTDGSTEIADRAAAADRRIRVLHHPDNENRGMSATRNLGLRHAVGEFVALLDADDVWVPHKLRRQVEIMRTHPQAAMVCGASEYWQSWATGDVVDDEIVPIGIAGGVLYPPPALSLGLYPLGTGAAPCPSDLLLRRSAAEAVGGFEEHFRGDRQLYEDQGFLAKFYLEHAVYVSDECLSRYRLRPDSCVATVTASGGVDGVRRYFLEWFAGHVDARPEADPRVVAAIIAARRDQRLDARARRHVERRVNGLRRRARPWVWQAARSTRRARRAVRRVVSRVRGRSAER